MLIFLCASNFSPFCIHHLLFLRKFKLVLKKIYLNTLKGLLRRALEAAEWSRDILIKQDKPQYLDTVRT